MSDIQNVEQKQFQIKKKRHGLYQWFEMTSQEVLDAFATLAGAQKIGEGDKQFVYVPGTRDDRVLLVAHADTVWEDSRPFSVQYRQGVFYSPDKGVGIGADDRAGIAMLWQLRDLGHSLLIPNAEETGCIGSRFLMEDKAWADELNEKHQFAVEFDRMNADDLAFYEIGSNKFKDWCEQQFPKYTRTRGTWTDICVLCKKITGVNVSVGYYNQHTETETLKEAEWQRTLSLTRKLLSQKNLPRFEQDPKPAYVPPVRTHSSSTCGAKVYDSYDSWHRSKGSSVIKNDEVEQRFSAELDSILVCYKCEAMMDLNEWKQNKEACLFCGEGF
jgi:hypothetical protein